MELGGRCYCGDIQYEIKGELQASLQCHCRECQYITGGNANTILGENQTSTTSNNTTVNGKDNTILNENNS